MRLGEAAALTLTQWAWLYSGKDRRLIGFDEGAGAWVSTSPIVAADTTGLGKPPAWATTADHREIRLSSPSRTMSDEMLGAVDEFRANHPYFPNSGIGVRLGQAMAPEARHVRHGFQTVGLKRPKTPKPQKLPGVCLDGDRRPARGGLAAG